MIEDVFIERLVCSYARARDIHDVSRLHNLSLAEANMRATIGSLFRLRRLELSSLLAEGLRHRQELANVLMPFRDSIVQRASSAFEVKGSTIAKYYPTGVFRGQSDLDIVVPDPNELFDVAGWLVRDGWSLRSFRTWMDTEAQQYIVHVERSDLMAGGEVVDIELRSNWLEGDAWWRGRRAVQDYPPRDSAVAALIGILEEGTTRPFRCRDLVDWQCVVVHLGTAERSLVVEYVVKYGLVSRLHAMARLCARYGCDVGIVLPHRWRRSEIPYWMRCVVRPLEWLSAYDCRQNRDNRFRPALPLIRVIHRLGFVRKAWASGALVFGAEIEGGTLLKKGVKTYVGEHSLMIESTIGTFAGSLGCDLDANWISSDWPGLLD